jgi:hypothetical protein
MADYKNIKGFNIQYLDSDPPNPIEGQMWFNSTSQTLKGAEVGGVPAGTWASGGDLNTARYRMMGGAGIQTAGLVVGGYSTGLSSAVESYNGTSWTTSTSFPITAADIGMTGTATASLAIGGNGPGNNTDGVYNFDGSSWTSTTSLPSAGARIQAIGTQTAALAVGGQAPPSQAYTNRTLEFDGSTWTTGGTYDTVLANGGCSGPSTAAFSFGGYTPSESTQAAQYNGTSWTETTSLNTARGETMFSGSGTQTSSMISQGGDPYTTLVTEAWNGTAWTEIADIASGRSAGGSFGTTSAMVVAGGTPPTTTATEEWTAPDLLVKTFTTS